VNSRVFRKSSTQLKIIFLRVERGGNGFEKSMLAGIKGKDAIYSLHVANLSAL